VVVQCVHLGLRKTCDWWSLAVVAVALVERFAVPRKQSNKQPKTRDGQGAMNTTSTSSVLDTLVNPPKPAERLNARKRRMLGRRMLGRRRIVKSRLSPLIMPSKPAILLPVPSSDVE